MGYHLPTTKKYDELTKKKQEFIDQHLKTGDRDEAYRLAGYSIKGRSWKCNARNLFMELSPVIKDRIELRFGGGAILAMNIVQEIMEDKKVSPAVRLNAAKDYLTRAGYDKPQETTVLVKDKRTHKQIDNEIADILGAQSADNSGETPEVKH